MESRGIDQILPLVISDQPRPQPVGAQPSGKPLDQRGFSRAEESSDQGKFPRSWGGHEKVLAIPPPPLGVKQNLKSIKQHEQFHHKTVFHQAKCRRNSCGIKSHTLFRISECKLLDWFISFQVDMPVGYRMARDPVCWT